ncbi:MAG: hypothetical protein JXB13_05790 [Phycisphaerae bacterium]|nr:hypothetical protein [Phycisphaerae bacterium]
MPVRRSPDATLQQLGDGRPDLILKTVRRLGMQARSQGRLWERLLERETSLVLRLAVFCVSIESPRE